MPEEMVCKSVHSCKHVPFVLVGDLGFLQKQQKLNLKANMSFVFCLGIFECVVFSLLGFLQKQQNLI